MKYFITILFSSLALLSNAQYQVGHQSLTLEDASRNRDIPTEVYYPADSQGDNVPFASGAFPLIVFGHGFGMSWTEYSVWWEELVSEGYIIAFPTTEASVFPFPSHGDFGQDMAFIVDEMMNMNQDMNSPFLNKFTNKNALMGHSMGGGCSYLAAGDYGANVETVISLAAADTDPSAISAAANIDVPVLTIAGSADCVVMDGGAPIDIYNGLGTTNYKAYVSITDASHCQFGIASFGSICTLGELCGGFLSDTDQHTQMFLNAKPWLDYFLKNDCDRWTDFKDNLYNSTAHTYQEAGSLPIPNLSLGTGTIDICDGANAMLYAQIDGPYCDFEWSVDGTTLPASVADSIMATIGGEYTLFLENADGQDISVSQTVNVQPNPTVEIEYVNDIIEISNLTGGTNYTYQWYAEAEPIPGANDMSVNPFDLGIEGVYYLVVTNEFGCTNISNEIGVLFPSIFTPGASFGFEMYPTMTSDYLYLELWTDEAFESDIIIYNYAGQKIDGVDGIISQNGVEILDVSHLERGAYLISIQGEKGILTKKFFRN